MSNVFSRILVGIDDSEPSRAAVRFAAALAREHCGEVVLCSAVNWLPLVAEVEGSGAMMDPEPIVTSVRDECAASLAKARAFVEPFGVAVRCLSPEGDPAATIVRVAVEGGCTLIVMGTHGRGGVSRAFLGSTTEDVLRESPVPVLTVHAESMPDAGSLRTFERIAVGVDESEPSDAALHTVFALPPEDREDVAFYTVTDDGATTDEARRIVDRAVATANLHGVAAEGHVLIGRPDRELTLAAREQHADVLVLGSHGRRGLGRFLLGSVAEEVVRASSIPVLVVRAAARARVTVPASAPVTAPA